MSQVSAISKKSGSDPFGLSPNDLSRIKILLNQESGIQIADDHFAMVHCRLVKILRDSGLPDFKSLIDKAEVPDGNELREKITSALTTNVTQFFREKHHFEHLTKNVLNRGEGGYGLHGLRIWSAGCSNGSEPYTAAITVMTHLKATEAAKARILGTDIDPNMIEAGRKGIYPAKELEPLTREAMLKYTQPVPGDANSRQMSEQLRKMVSFRRLNLHNEWPMKRKFDAIFCRNVAIYFDDRTREKLWMRFHDALKPGGFLYIGHSERVRGRAQTLFLNCASTTYQRVD